MEKALQHVGRDIGDVLGSIPGPGSLASCPGLQVWEPVRCSHAPHMETQRVSALWSRPVGMRATPRCSSLLPEEEEPEASHEGSSEGPGRCNPRRVTRSEHGLGWTFPPSCPLPPALQSCSWGCSEPGLQLCPQGTPGPSRILWAACCIESMSICLMHSVVKQYKNVRVWSRKSFIAGPCKQRGGSCVKTPKLPKSSQQSPFIEK